MLFNTFRSLLSIVTLFFITFILSSYIHANVNTKANSNANDSESIIQTLKNASVKEMIPMQVFLKSKGKTANFDNEVYLIKLNVVSKYEEKKKEQNTKIYKENNELKAVFKPVPPDDLGDAHAEVAAYKASLFLGFPNVPPTVIRKINGKIGSLQLYVEPEIHISSAEEYRNILDKASKEDVANLKLFYFIFGQWDSGSHNLILRKKGEDGIQLIAIDNSGIRNRQYVKYGEPPFVRIAYSDNLKSNDWHLSFPFEKTQVIQNPTEESLEKLFGKYFPSSVYKKLLRFEKSIYYVLYRNSLWIQYHKADSNFIISHSDYYPEKTISAFEKLDRNAIETIFSEAKGSDFLTPDYYQAILERRDQVIKDYEKKGGLESPP